MFSEIRVTIGNANSCRTKIKKLLLPLLLLVCSLNLMAESLLTTTIQTKSYSIGKTNNGCISGAKALPLQGGGYIVLHLERDRHYGHPLLIKTLQTLAKQAQQQQLGILQIGDLGQALGGALPFGHRSHQSGLDADVWFNLNPNSYVNANKQRSNIKQFSMLSSNGKGKGKGKGKGLNTRWTNKHRKLLELAAKIVTVDRIFVNPAIKRDLCKTVTEDRQWLRKIRPWYHHDKHFHIRLSCPKSSPDCIKQAPIPAGISCDASLTWWFKKHPATISGAIKKRTGIPKACQVLLSD